MKSLCSIQSMHPTFDRTLIVSVEVKDAGKIEELNNLRGKNLDLELKVHRDKRSLNANAYFHVLADQIAKVENSSLTEIKNHLIAEYGQFERDEDGKIPHIILDDKVEWQKVTYLHLYPTQRTQVLGNGKLYRVYLVRRGSHTYDTKEMSQLIQATVDEAQLLGIETLPPEELKRMCASWKGGA